MLIRYPVQEITNYIKEHLYTTAQENAEMGDLTVEQFISQVAQEASGDEIFIDLPVWIEEVDFYNLILEYMDIIAAKQTKATSDEEARAMISSGLSFTLPNKQEKEQLLRAAELAGISIASKTLAKKALTAGATYAVEQSVNASLMVAAIEASPYTGAILATRGAALIPVAVGLLVGFIADKSGLTGSINDVLLKAVEGFTNASDLDLNLLAPVKYSKAINRVSKTPVVADLFSYNNLGDIIGSFK